MLLAEPPPSQADLHFRLFGIPVRVHPYFWVVSLLLGMGGFRAGKAEPKVVLIWVAVVFVSILVHELGHAFLQRFFGGHPWITLYSFGGLASCNDCDRSPRNQIMISLAGPVAGFILAGLIVAVMHGFGHFHGFTWSLIPFLLEGFENPTLNLFIYDMLFVNIIWGLVNLLPIYPLDGGQIARELFNVVSPRQGTLYSLQLSMGTAVLVTAYGLLRRDWFLALMFGFLAYGSYQSLTWYRNNWR